MPLRTADVFRSNIITAPELLSDGYGPNSIYLSTVLSTTSATRIITVVLPADDVSLLYEGDYQVNPNDIIYLAGTLPSGAADGYYTINEVLTDTSFSVNESLADSADGYIQFRFQAGATLVGVDSSKMRDVTGNTAQEAIAELDNLKISASDHEVLRQLIHFIDEGPADGFMSGAYKETIPFGAFLPTSIVWYVDDTKTKLIVSEEIIWLGIVPSTITWQVYNTDGVTVAHTVSDEITYTNNIFETTRTRTIS